MYSYDDRIRAVRLYIQYDKSAAAVKPQSYESSATRGGRPYDTGTKSISGTMDLRKSPFGHRNTMERRKKPR